MIGRRILVTAGPTREHIDSVRFITNASSGRMGYAVAAAARRAGCDVILLSGPVGLAAPPGCRVVPFVSADDLRAAMHAHFPDCDAVIMAAAVGDFRVQKPFAGKIPRSGGPITIRLVPTEDILAGLARLKRPGQLIVAFAVEDGPRRSAQAKALAKLAAKGADFIVVNTPAAMAADRSDACILARLPRRAMPRSSRSKAPAGRIVLPWARRDKDQLARLIIRLLDSTWPDSGEPARVD